MTSKHKKKTKTPARLRNMLYITILPILLLAGWQWLAQRGAVSKMILPAPTMIAQTWKKYILNGTYGAYLSISLQRFLKGFLVGTLLGLFFGVAMGLSRGVNIALTGIMGLLRPIPNVGWIPLSMLIFGVHEMGKVVLVAIGCFWPVFIDTYDGIRNVDYKYRELARSLGKSTWTTITRVILPAAFPMILTGIKQGFSNSWKSIVAAEMIATSEGIGFMIAYARSISRPDIMYVGLATVAIIGLVLDLIINKIQDTIIANR